MIVVKGEVIDQIKGLLEQLQSDDPSVVREAAFTAADLRCEMAVPSLAALLKSRHR